MALEEKDKAVLREQSATKTGNEWVEYFNNKYSYKQIWAFCNHAGLPLSNEDKYIPISPHKHIDVDYFKEWSHDMAYVLGMWYAKGNIYDNKIFDITINKKDKFIIKQIAESMGYGNPIIDAADKQVVRINFYSDIVCKDINAIGGKNCPKDEVVFPKDNIPQEYLVDFIRGFFDGTGMVMNIKNNRINVTFTYDSKNFLHDLYVLLCKHAKVKKGSYDPYNRCLKFGERDSQLIGEYLYKDDPRLFLERKFLKFNIC